MFNMKLSRIGLLIVASLLIGCAKQPKPSVRIDYSPEFFECVALDVEQDRFSPCTINALSDWEVVVAK